MSQLRDYHYPDHYRQFLGAVTEHEMTVLHDEGLYRHLKFAKPGTMIWSWEIVTWPGSLAIRGDIGLGLVFTRLEDMLQFFDDGQPDGWINPSYWGEKLSRGTRDVEIFSGKKFVEWVREELDSTGRKLSDIEWDSIESVYSTELAVEVLNEIELDWDYEDPETWKDWDHHFLLALHAILWSAKKYHNETKET